MTTRTFRWVGIEALAMALLLLIVRAFMVPERVTYATAEWHVCKTGGGDFTTIQGAVDAAAPNDVIKVAAGTYTEAKGTYNLLVTKTVHLLGGYICGNWQTRDPQNNVTVILPSTSTISVVALIGGVGNSTNFTPTLDGFTITGGGGGNHGGGIRATDSRALIRNNVIAANVGYLLGGGVWVQRGAPRIENNLIQNNRVTYGGDGGGVELEESAAVLSANIIANNVISDSSGYGGGVAILGPTAPPVTLVANTISGNMAAVVTGGVGYGGGVYVSSAAAILSNNTVEGNAANGAFAFSFDGDFGFGGGIYVANSPVFTLTGNTIVSNTAGYKYYLYESGGGLEVVSSAGVLAGNVIAGNQANANTLFGNGGGLAVYSSTLAIWGGQFLNNVTSINCEGYGGGLYASASSVSIDATRFENNCAGDSPFYGLGGGLAFISSPYTLTNALIVNNRAFNDDTAVGGLFAGTNSTGLVVNNTVANNRGQGIRIGSPLALVNNIIMGQTTGVSVTAAMSVNATYNDFYNDATNQRGFALDASNMVVNPQLDATWHLLPGSPLIDAGTHSDAPDHDMDGEPRAMIGTSGLYKIDIGADEFTGTPQRQVNLDTTAADLTIIGPGGIQGHPDPNANNWIGYSVMGSDVNGDGRADLLIAAQDWAEDFNTLNATGRVFGLSNFGARVTGTIDLYTTTPALNVVSRFQYQHVGQAFASGDLNGDGKRDLIVSANNDDNTKLSWPAVFVLFGGPGLNGTRTLSDVTPADFTLRAPGPDYGRFANKNMLAAGDVSGDGIDDLLVGDSLANDGVLTHTGAVFVTFGGSTLTGSRNLSTTLANFTLYGPAADAQLSKLATGHLGANAQPYLVARTATTAYGIVAPIAAGSHHLSSLPADLMITGLQPGGIWVMDFNGDGQDDLLLGSLDKLYVLPGPFSAGQSFDVVSRAALTLTHVTANVFASGDVVGDARPDLIVGQAGASSGPVVVIPGGLKVSGTQAVEDVAAFMLKGSAVRFVGQDVAAGDLDGDGKSDLIVGSLFANVDDHPPGFDQAGKVFVFYGVRSLNDLYLPFIAK